METRGRGLTCRGQPRPYSKGAGPPAPPVFGVPLLMHTLVDVERLNSAWKLTHMGSGTV